MKTQLCLKKRLIISIALIIFLLMNCNRSQNPTTADKEEHTDFSFELNYYDPFDSTAICDYLIITDESLLYPSLHLAAYRDSNDLDDVVHPLVVTTQTLDSNYGMYYKYAQERIVKKAIQATQTNWKHKPKYITLFADNSIKPRLNTGIPIPDSTKFADLYYSFIDSNTIPDVIIGRIPASTEMDGINYVKKLKAFESAYINDLLVIVDDYWKKTEMDPLNFEVSRKGISAHLDSLPFFNLKKTDFLLSSFSVADTIPLTIEQTNAATKDLIDSLNSANSLILFLGHAHAQQLTDESILTTYDLHMLRKIGFWVSYGCNSNQFVHEDSFSKELLRMPGGGAVAFVAPYFLGYVNTGQLFINSYYKQMYSGRSPISAGEAYCRAMQDINWTTGNGFFIYLGDPALMVHNR